MIIRVKKSQEAFTVIPNRILNDTELTLGALAVLTYLLSKPDDWKVRRSELAARFKCSNYAIRVALKDLKDAGYTKTQWRPRYDETGEPTNMKAGSELIVLDTPEKVDM